MMPTSRPAARTCTWAPSHPVGEELSAAEWKKALAPSKPLTDGKEGPDAWLVGTLERGRVVSHFAPDHVQARFRAFETFEAGAQAWVTMMVTSRYNEAGLSHAVKGTAGSYVEAVEKKGYFGAALGPSKASVESLYARNLPVALPRPHVQQHATLVARRNPVLTPRGAMSQRAAIKYRGGRAQS